MLYNFSSIKAERTFKRLPLFNTLETMDHIVHLVMQL